MVMETIWYTWWESSLYERYRSLKMYTDLKKGNKSDHTHTRVHTKLKNKTIEDLQELVKKTLKVTSWKNIIQIKSLKKPLMESPTRRFHVS